MKRGLGAALLRLFTVQGSWNYERLIGTGVGVATEPLLRELGAPDSPAYRAALARSARFFNSHPYLAGVAVGATARAEIDGVPPVMIERLRAALTGPLGSVGDRLVWTGWLPLLSALALAGIARGAGVTAVIAFLAVYNAGHVALRWWGLRSGWALGPQVAVALQASWLRVAAAVVIPATACALGFALPFVVQGAGIGFHGWARIALAGTAAGGFALLVWRPDLLSGLRLGLILVAAALVAGWVWR
ncbi:MAG TPA: PTS system mannose/fructose/sorbose family transporter subunit IID [Gemmatimonadales bacterium]|nr:PTS system mannose/fructose/sorbose family transporter subunit IID [Gemmatimonadales bacterium]